MSDPEVPTGYLWSNVTSHPKSARSKRPTYVGMVVLFRANIDRHDLPTKTGYGEASSPLEAIRLAMQEAISK